MSPQAFNIRLRPGAVLQAAENKLSFFTVALLSCLVPTGEKVSFDVSVKPAENFPIDLYYLMDMSFSMADDLQNLKKLGGSLGQIGNQLSVCVLVCQSICLSVCPFVCLSICRVCQPSVCLFVSQSVCLFVFVL